MSLLPKRVKCNQNSGAAGSRLLLSHQAIPALLQTPPTRGIQVGEGFGAAGIGEGEGEFLGAVLIVDSEFEAGAVGDAEEGSGIGG